MILYYSGCGNSRFVAQQIAERTSDTLRFIPDMRREGDTTISLADGEALGFIFPVYAWAPPRLVLEFLEHLAIASRPAYLYMVCTCGDEVGYTERFFRRAIERKGLTLDAAFSFIMPETYLNFPGFRLDNDQQAVAKIHSVRDRLPKVAAAITLRQQISDVHIGPLPWIKSYLLEPLFYSFIISDRGYSATDRCVGCGACAKACPLHNITIVNNRPVWKGNCTQCMACYHVCPQNAVQYKKYTKGKGQYRLKRYL